MRLSLRYEAKKAIEAYEKVSRKDWVTRFPGQIILACNIVYWTSEVTKVSSHTLWSLNINKPKTFT